MNNVCNPLSVLIACSCCCVASFNVCCVYSRTSSFARFSVEEECRISIIGTTDTIGKCPTRNKAQLPVTMLESIITFINVHVPSVACIAD